MLDLERTIESLRLRKAALKSLVAHAEQIEDDSKKLMEKAVALKNFFANDGDSESPRPLKDVIVDYTGENFVFVYDELDFGTSVSKYPSTVLRWESTFLFTGLSDCRFLVSHSDLRNARVLPDLE